MRMRQTGVPLRYLANRNCRKLVEQAFHWRLWGVLFTGASSSLLFEHGGGIFQTHGTLLLRCLVVLPVMGGVLTPEKPAYTVVVFAVGSVPPLNDIPPIPIGLWPLLQFGAQCVGPKVDGRSRDHIRH